LDGPHLLRLLAAMDEVEHAHDLVRRQGAEHRQTDIAMSLEIAEDQRDDEHFLVIAHVAVVGVPGTQAHVETRIAGDDILVDRPDLVLYQLSYPQVKSGGWDSNPRPLPYEGLYARAIGYGLFFLVNRKRPRGERSCCRCRCG